jgi:hypothetical protein
MSRPLYTILWNSSCIAIKSSIAELSRKFIELINLSNRNGFCIFLSTHLFLSAKLLDVYSR